jgi:hypothetical protein
MRIASGLLGVLLAATAVAAEDPLATRSGWEVGGQIARYRYEEPDFMWLKGNRFGVTGAYTETNEKRVYGRIEASWSYGELEYQSSGTGTQNNVPDHLLETRMLAGRDYPRGSLVWSPYAGAAFRYLYNDLRGISSTGARGYRRESLYFYVPLGLTLRMPLGADWALAPQLEYNGFVRGVQRSHLSDAGPGFNDVGNQQRQGRGYRAQLMVEGRRWAFGTWMHYWKIKDSDIQPIGAGLGGVEPANWTRETGVELRYRF